MKAASRRWFLERAVVAVGALSQASSAKGARPSASGAAEESRAGAALRYGTERCVVEWAYNAGIPYADLFNDLELDVVFTDPGGQEQRVPAFWAGEQAWRVRYSPATAPRGRPRANHKGCPCITGHKRLQWSASAFC
jgi:hypothetical protein